MRQESEKHAAHVRQLTNQMENLKELLHTYEISIGRKDEVTCFSDGVGISFLRNFFFIVLGLETILEPSNFMSL